MRSVVKARYVRGERGVGKMAAHVDYIRHRAGPDRGGGEGRPIFDASRASIRGDEVKHGFREILDESRQRSPLIAHKLILSPGLNAVDLQDYTREIMDKLGSEKGLDLTWYAVKHENTENNHAHVVVLGRDKNGVEVSISKRDLDRIRDLGDRYIEREHQLERYLQRESDRALLSRDYDRQGDREFQKLVGDVYRQRDELEPAAGKERDSGREEREEEQTDRGRSDSSSKSSSGADSGSSKKRKYIEWSQEKAVEKLPADEKIVADGKTYSRFSSSEDLEKLDEYLKADYSHYLPKEQYGMLGTWRATKEKYGDDCYEKQAKYKHDKKFNKGYDKEGNAVRDIEEHRLLDKELRRSLNISDGRYQKMSRQEYKYVSRGRLTEEHVHYSSIQNIARLELLKEKFPERAQEFDSEIAEVRKYDVQQLKDRGWESFDELVNGKPTERAKGRKQNEKEATEDKQAKDGREVDREAGEIREQDKEQEKERENEHKDPGHEGLESDGRDESKGKDRDREERDRKEDKADKDVSEKSAQELTKETGKGLDRSEGEQLEQGQAKDKSAERDPSAANAEARNSMEAHGRVEGIQQDQSRDDKEQDRGDDDSDGRGR